MVFSSRRMIVCEANSPNPVFGVACQRTLGVIVFRQADCRPADTPPEVIALVSREKTKSSTSESVTEGDT